VSDVNLEMSGAWLVDQIKLEEFQNIEYGLWVSFSNLHFSE
jgi:hypothetical protein